MTEFEDQGIVWRKSTVSTQGSCVEVAVHDGSVLIRDSMNRTGPVLSLPRGAWPAFLAWARRDDSDIRRA